MLRLCVGLLALLLEIALDPADTHLANGEVLEEGQHQRSQLTLIRLFGALRTVNVVLDVVEPGGGEQRERRSRVEGVPDAAGTHARGQIHLERGVRSVSTRAGRSDLASLAVPITKDGHGSKHAGVDLANSDRATRADGCAWSPRH